MRYEKVIAVVQARLESRALPGKVLLAIGRAPMLERVVERVERMQRIDGLLVATSVDPEDDRIEELCRERGWACYRGSREDVLDRIHRAAQSVFADHVVRVDGDQPLLGWQEADALVDLHLKSGADLTHNLTARGSGMPLGTGCEVIRAGALERAWRDATAPSQREHPTEHLHAHPDHFRILSRRAPPELARPSYRFGVELPDDLERVRRIQRALGERAFTELGRAVALIDGDAAKRGVAL
jgi:spore coat polysaccharide biosynthesis protein SpsF